MGSCCFLRGFEVFVFIAIAAAQCPQHTKRIADTGTRSFMFYVENGN
jgi:hypothetical protein